MNEDVIELSNQINAKIHELLALIEGDSTYDGIIDQERLYEVSEELDSVQYY
jgi:hypothetical protein